MKGLFVDHVVLVVTDIVRSKKFYSKLLGKPEGAGKDSVWFQVGSTKLFLGLPYGKLPKGDTFNPNRVGLEHLAFGVYSLSALKKIEASLSAKKIKSSGIHVDNHSKKEKIWLDDPDGIRLEFFLRK